MTEQRKLEIAARLRELYEDSDETYLSIAEFIGVRERTAASWLSPSAPEPISYKSAKKYAELFGVTIDWLWRGEEGVRVPADFMERFAALEKRVEKLSEDAPRSRRAVRAARVAGQASRKAQKKSPGTQKPKARKRPAD